jgi:hypothetical protein
MGAFDDYQPPTTKGGAFGDYQPPGAPPAAASGSAADPDSAALWNMPAGVSVWDQLKTNLAKPFQGAGQAADDYARAITDAGSFGTADRLAAYMGGTSLAEERQKTADAYKRLGPIMGTAASAIGYGPVGELGLGARAAEAMGGGWLAGVGGAAAEGAGAGAVGAAGHDESIGKGAIVGGLAGGAGGATGGVAGRGGALAPAVDAATLLANKSGAYQQLGGVLYDNTDVRQAATNAINEIAQREPRIARNGAGALKALDDIGNNQALLPGAQSGEDINDFIRSLKKVNTGDSVDEAGQIGQRHMQGVLANSTPIVAGGQVPGQAGAGASALEAANTAYGRLQDTQRLADWQAKAAVPGAPDVGAQAASFLASQKGQKLAAQPGWANQADALSTLAETARPMQVTAMPSTFDIRHMAAPLVEGAVAGSLGSAAEGHFDPQHFAEEALIGGLTGYGLHKTIPAIQGAAQQAAQNRAIAAARVALSTGAQQSPVLPAAPWRDALRSLIYGQAARGAY